MLTSGAEVRVGCFQEEDRDTQAVEFLNSRCAEVVAPRLTRSRVRELTSLRGLLSGEPLTVPFFRHSALAKAVNRWCATPPDLVFVYSSSMAQYALRCDAKARVMHFAELDSDKWRQYAEVGLRGRLGRIGLRWIYSREAKRLLEFEDRVARTFDRSLVVSEVEKELFTEQIPGVVPSVLPNGVDVDHFASQGDDMRHPQTAVFTGVMDYEPNIDGVCWFVEECWPTLRQRHPDARLLIVGSSPVPQVYRLSGRDGILVTGRVETTPPYFDEASVAIAPLRMARGVQNKVLEAMSMSLPVVASPQASQGLGDVPTSSLCVAEGAEATIRGVDQWFADPARARADGQAAGEWVRQTWRWERMYQRFDDILAELGASVRAR